MTNAIFTLLYNVNYLPGALVLGAQLKKAIAKTQFDEEIALGVLIDKLQFSTLQLNLLSTYYQDIIDVSVHQSTLVDKLRDDLQRPELAKTFTKIELWGLDQYEKVLYLDADTLPLILELETPTSDSTVIDLLKLEFAQGKILAAPDSGFPDIFNSGVFLLKPNKETYNDLKNLVQHQQLQSQNQNQNESRVNQSISFDGADQGLLNQYFNIQPNWVQTVFDSGNLNLNVNGDLISGNSAANNWIKLPFLYNVTPSVAYEYLPAFKHFQGLPLSPLSKPTHPSQHPLLQEKKLGQNEGGNDAFYDEKVLQLSIDTLGRYHSTAVRFINAKSQIKVMHFIGPYKPWTLASTAQGIHRNWWNVWIEEFGEHSIEQVINNEQSDLFADIKMPTKELINTDLGDEKLTDKHENNAFQEAKPQGTKSDPFALSDSARYQQFKDTIKPSRDAMWDPAKEPPPKYTKSEGDSGHAQHSNIFQFNTYESWHEPKEVVVHEAAMTPQERGKMANEPVHETEMNYEKKELNLQEEVYTLPSTSQNQEVYTNTFQNPVSIKQEMHNSNENNHHHDFKDEFNQERNMHDKTASLSLLAPLALPNSLQSAPTFVQEHKSQEKPPPPQLAPPTQTPPPSTPPPPQQQQQQQQPPPLELPDLYGHKYVEPERVFDASSDYYPTHILRDHLEKIDINQDGNDSASILTPGSSAGAVIDSAANAKQLGAEVSSYNYENEKLQKQGLIDADHLQEAIDFEEDEEGEDEDDVDDYSESHAPKLFPWEFREVHRPERRFS